MTDLGRLGDAYARDEDRRKDWLAGRLPSWRYTDEEARRWTNETRRELARKIEDIAKDAAYADEVEHSAAALVAAVWDRLTARDREAILAAARRSRDLQR